MQIVYKAKKFRYQKSNFNVKYYNLELNENVEFYIIYIIKINNN